MQSCAIRHACFVFVCLFWLEGDWDGHGWSDHIVGNGHWMDTVSQITFSNSVRLTQARPKYWPKLHNQARRPRERYSRSDKENE